MTVLVLAVFIGGWLFFGDLFGGVILLLAVASSIFVQVALHNRSVRLWQSHYQQIESLFSVFSQIKFNAPLQPTRGSAVAPDFIAILISMIQEHKPRVIVELGSGLSTIICAYGLRAIGEGAVISLDHEERYVSMTRGHLVKHKLQDIAKVVHVPLREVTIKGRTYSWYDIDALRDVGQIDMLIVDGPPDVPGGMARYPAVPLLFDRLSDNAVVLLDDASRAPERMAAEIWMREHDSLVGEFIPTEHGTYVIRKTGDKR